MFIIKVFHPITGDFINHIENFIEISMTQELSNEGTLRFCVSCKDKSLDTYTRPQNKRDKVCMRIEMFCNDGNGGVGKIFDGYIFKIEEMPDRLCVDCIDCGSRLKYRLIHQAFSFSVGTSVSSIISTIRNHINSFSPLEVQLGTITAPGSLAQTQQYQVGMTFFDILKDLAEKSGGERRVKDCKIDFSVPDVNDPYGTGVLLDGVYMYVAGGKSNNINDFILTTSLEGFCNSKLSRDKYNAKQYCVVPITPSPTLADCGLRECFESNPDGHDFSGEDILETLPTIRVDTNCEKWCNICIGDRKRVRMKLKQGKKYDFFAIFTKKNIQCTGSQVTVDFELNSTNKPNRRRTNSKGVYEALSDRVRRIELN